MVEQMERNNREARAIYDPALVRESKWGVRHMSTAQWSTLEGESNEVTRSITALVDRAPGHREVWRLVARHDAMTGRSAGCWPTCHNGACSPSGDGL